MESNSIEQIMLLYKEQLLQVGKALSHTKDPEEQEKLIALKNDIEQLLNLTCENYSDASCSSVNDIANNSLEEEYEEFVTQMQKEGAITHSNKECTNEIDDQVKALEGTRCKAPHKHSWGDTMYHNALICSILCPLKNNDYEVKVMFINPTHQEMLPCPYLLDSDCKFSEDKCRFSHGKVVLFSQLKEYEEPNFEDVKIGSKVLAKGINKLWHRASVKRLFNKKCIVNFDCQSKDIELEFHDILPLGNEDVESDHDIDGEIETNYEDVINMSLVVTPSTEVLGGWEKFTKGIGSKLMAKMGYVTGTGLGKCSDGILEPVSAVILPPGKSLDHCMKLRENANGDKDLFNAERKLKRLQKKQEIRNQKAYEREKSKVDVFNFLNHTLAEENCTPESSSLSKAEHRQQIKNENARSLNVASLKIEENIRKVERNVAKIKDNLKRHSNKNSQVYKKLLNQLNFNQHELKMLQDQEINIRNEQSVRHSKKTLTVF
ncbi:zinc finger ccch-type with g patch domain-containing protein [Holotrichia oblita]|uniref:Zinc finger ccch-type with g patch domain-containing protein n=2 Tax=Holotrichia oblita TaxID=644536 RepID=A0ACB9SUL9_HOLOL|nr:zinc finger ccch-type with g patch domain-containing protein [Holotrichia oblita]KAI4458014.1 zinc finger ccch-type with g patch domain-containing protein [Holotrichia oblita]